MEASPLHSISSPRAPTPRREFTWGLHSSHRRKPFLATVNGTAHFVRKALSSLVLQQSCASVPAVRAGPRGGISLTLRVCSSRNSFFFLLHQLNNASWPIPEHGLSWVLHDCSGILLTLSVFSLETALCVVRLMECRVRANLVALQHHVASTGTHRP